MLFPNAEEWERHFGRRPRWNPVKLEALAARLVRIMEWSRTGEPEDMFQEVIGRLLQNIEEQPELLDLDDATPYVRGIARNVMREARKKRRETVPLPDDFPSRNSAFRRLSPVEMAILLGELKSMLSAKEWDLIRQSVVGRAEEWRALNGVSEGAFRVRLHRIRRKLEQAVDSRLNSAGNVPGGACTKNEHST